MHRISTGVTTEIASEGDNPQLHGNNVVWECGDVCLYEINTGVTTRIADNDHPGNGSQSPRVYGDYVVFTSDEDGDDEIYLYRISTGVKHKLTNNTSIDSWPDIDEDHIVWVNGNFDILLYKISTGATTNISNNQNWNASPSISGDYVVWMGGNPSNIYLYQISTSTITQITNDAASDRVPQINGNHVVWLKYAASGNIKDVYLYAINSSTSKKIASTDTEFTWDLETGPYVKGDFVT